MRVPALLEKATLSKVVEMIKISPHIGESVLPFVPVATEKTMWDIVESDMGIAKFVAPDAESPMVDKLTISQAVATLASIREKERFSESDLRAMREAGQLPVLDGQTLLRGLRDEAERKLRASLNRLKLRVAGRVEWARWQALQGTITYDDGEVKFAVDYGIPSANKVTLTGTSKWDDTTNSDPIANIGTWLDTYIENNSGLSFTRMYISRAALRYIAQNAKVRDLLKYNNNINPAAFGSLPQTKQLILAMTELLQVVVFDSFYENSSGTAVRFLPANKVIFIPEPVTNGETLGDVADGPHAHNGYQPGYYTWTETKADPYARFVGVGRECFPRIYHPEWIFIATVY